MSGTAECVPEENPQNPSRSAVYVPIRYYGEQWAKSPGISSRTNAMEK